MPIVSRVIASALRRTGLLDQLRSQWNKDLHALERQVKERADGVNVSLQRQQQIADAQRTHGLRLKDLHDSVHRLTNQVTTLTATCTRLEERTRALEETIARNRQESHRVMQFRAAVADGSLARHVTNTIAAAEVLSEPAPMVLIERLFPEDIYETLLAAIPPRAAFTTKDKSKADYRVGRPQAAVPDLCAEVWSYLDEELIPRTIAPQIARYFAPFVRPYYQQLFGPELGDEVVGLALETSETRLMLRRPGYHLLPHLDPKRVLFTGLIYFARPGDSEAYGTAFYRVDGAVVRDHASTYYPHSDNHRCELARTVPFRPNTACVFLNSAAHGAEIPSTAPSGLERYALQFYVGPSIDALTQIVRRLPDDARAAWGKLATA